MFTLNCKGRVITASRPLVMGIINATPDSFYEGSRLQETDLIVQKAAQMLRDGAAILDIGGQSTRPGSDAVSESEELERIIGPIAAIHQQLPEAVIAVDTFHANVAAAAVAAGASMVNDISGGEMDSAMLSTVGGLKVPYVCMHMKGTPQTMQQHSVYDDVAKEVIDYFIHKLDACKKAGIHDVIIDPGFGFAKTIEQNFRLLKDLALLKILGKPILAGLSRKGTIYKTLGVTATDALNGTSVLNTLALHNGAAILRVHDVKEAVEAVTLFCAYQDA
ncbi:MAG: dihydropteroate synthase [Chitinophagaceae bacterium]